MMLTELIENFLNLYSSDDDSDAVERVSEREIILHESYTPERITNLTAGEHFVNGL